MNSRRLKSGVGRPTSLTGCVSNVEAELGKGYVQSERDAIAAGRYFPGGGRLCVDVRKKAERHAESHVCRAPVWNGYKRLDLNTCRQRAYAVFCACINSALDPLTGLVDVPQIKLTRKLALHMNGVDVSRLKVGDVIDLPHEQAVMMVECGWAEFLVEPMLDVSLPRKSQSDLAN